MWDQMIICSLVKSLKLPISVFYHIFYSFLQILAESLLVIERKNIANNKLAYVGTNRYVLSQMILPTCCHLKILTLYSYVFPSKRDKWPLLLYCTPHSLVLGPHPKMACIAFAA